MGRRSRRLGSALLGAFVALAAVGCGSTTGIPRGSPSTARLVSPASPSARSCLRRLHGTPASVAGRGVGRSGRRWESLTFRAGRLLLGCDRLRGAGRWCGAAVGLIRGGRLADPRLSLTCRRAGGRRVGFGWIEPVGEARWVAVAGAGVRDLYRVVARLPVRVATTSVSLDAAVFAVTQYAADGHELERRRIVMQVSG